MCAVGLDDMQVSGVEIMINGSQLIPFDRVFRLNEFRVIEVIPASDPTRGMLSAKQLLVISEAVSHH